MYQGRILHLKTNNLGYRMQGICASACTMYMSVPGMCVDRHADIWFHAASQLHFGGNRVISMAGSHLMMSAYPPRVQRYLYQRRALESLTFTKVSGATLISLGVNDCDKHPSGSIWSEKKAR